MNVDIAVFTIITILEIGVVGVNYLFKHDFGTFMYLLFNIDITEEENGIRD